MPKLNLNTAESLRTQLTAQQQKSIAYLYSKASKDVAKQAKLLKGKQNISAVLQQKYLNKLQSQIDERMQQAQNELDEMVTGNMKSVASAVTAASFDFADKLGLQFSAELSHVPDSVVKNIVTGKVYEGKWSLSTAIWKENKKIHSDVRKVIAQGVVEQKSAYDIAKDIEKYINPDARKDWSWSKVYPGTNKKVDYSAQRLARTLVSHAYQQAFVQSTKNNPFVTAYRWHSAHSSRVCPICADRDGKLFAKNDLPMDHPNGMCTFEAEIPDSMEKIADRLADWVQGKNDPDLDAWMADLQGQGKLHTKGEEKDFSETQHKWLGSHGYSPNNMPTSFKDFMMSLSYDETNELLALSGVTWSHPHPYQEMEKWYNKNLAKVGVSVKKNSPVEKAVEKKVSKKQKANDLTPENMRKRFSGNSSLKMRKMLNAQFDKWLNEVTPDEKQGVVTYTGSAYTDMNRHLRGIEPTTSRYTLQAIKDCKAALNKAHTDEAIVVGRGSYGDSLAGMLGVRYPGDVQWFVDNKESLIGGLAQDKGFLSTTPYEGGGFSGEVIYRINVPKGAHGVYVDSISLHQGEKEFLLQAGSKFRVVDIQKKDSYAIEVFLDMLK